MTSLVAYTTANNSTSSTSTATGLIHSSTSTRMDAFRPRPSILSLFDPLSSPSQSERALSPDSDKENHGDISFFHPPGTHRQAQPPMRTLRRRLVDIGDMTMDDPDIRDLLADEVDLEEEINHSVAEEDENDTLTFRDMAKAATPKWSARRTSTLTTPESSPTPRTPLADLSLKDETTPIARKKLYKRQIIPVASKLSQIESVNPEKNVQPVDCSFPSMSTPTIEISCDKDGPHSPSDSQNSSGETLGSSVCTLNLPTPPDTLISDTPIPVLISPSSPQSFHVAPAVLSPLAGTRLRPKTANVNNNRYSIDLQASFQIQLNAETTFDLLNDKISFFSSKNGNDSFLNNLEEYPSFGEGDFGSVQSKHSKAAKNPAELPTGNVANEGLETDLKVNAGGSVPHLEINQPGNVASEISPNLVDMEAVTHNVNPFEDLSSTSKNCVQISALPDFAFDAKASSMLSTPSSSNAILQHPPRPVPALRIVKRSKALAHPKNTSETTTTSASRRNSSITAIHIPASRITAQPSPANRSGITAGKNGDVHQQAHVSKRTAPAATLSSTSQLRDGPRRVLISEGPKLHSNPRISPHVEGRSSSTVNGPRRVPVTAPTNVTDRTMPLVKPVAQAGSGLRQPVKYATVGPASAIPKPVGRSAGSKLPAPITTNSKQRFGVPTGIAAPSKGLASRRVT